MSSRRHYLPTATSFAKISPIDQWKVLDWYLRELEQEKDGFVVEDHQGRGHRLKNLRARERRLEKLANEFGFWSEGK